MNSRQEAHALQTKLRTPSINPLQSCINVTEREEPIELGKRSKHVSSEQGPLVATTHEPQN